MQRSIVMTIAGLWLVLGLSSAFAQYAPYQQTAEDEYWVATLGKIKDLNEKEPVLAKARYLNEDGEIMAEEKVFVRWIKINKDTGRWVVLSGICPYLKCLVEWDSNTQKFIDPCFGCEYDIDGEWLKGPDKSPLPDYSDLAYEEDGMLMLKRLAE